MLTLAAQSTIPLASPSLARAHRHARILRIISVNYTIFSVPEPRLAPRAAIPAS